MPRILHDLNHGPQIFFLIIRFNFSPSMYEVKKHHFGGMGHVFGQFIFKARSEEDDVVDIPIVPLDWCYSAFLT